MDVSPEQHKWGTVSSGRGETERGYGEEKGQWPKCVNRQGLFFWFTRWLLGATGYYTKRNGEVLNHYTKRNSVTVTSQQFFQWYAHLLNFWLVVTDQCFGVSWTCTGWELQVEHVDSDREVRSNSFPDGQGTVADRDGLGGRQRQGFIKKRSWKISSGGVGAQRLREDMCHPVVPGRREPVVAETRRDMDLPRSVVCGLRCLRLRYSRSAAQIGRLGCRLQQQQQQQRK